MPGAVVKRKKAIQGPSHAGKLKIGDNWNAISIIALSQNNPLKAIAEFVENSIDARAKHITIIRGKEQGEYYLKIIDDGQGIHLDENGMPDFKYVATHICDSIKKQLKKQGEKDIQGEFGIGLLSFWTVGDKLTLTSAGVDGKIYQMVIKKISRATPSILNELSLPTRVQSSSSTPCLRAYGSFTVKRCRIILPLSCATASAPQA